MFSRTVLLALFASALSASAAPSLSLILSGANDVDGVKNLKVSATLSNTGDENIKLLNDPRTLLSTLPTNAFGIVHEDSGASPSFVGAAVKYVPEVAVKIGGAGAFTTLAPGASVTIVHDLSAAYNFTGSGEGKYSFEPSNLFHSIDESGKVTEIRAFVADAHTAKVSGTLAVARPIEKRATYNGCSSTQQSQALAAASAANTYAASAKAYASSHTASTSRYTTWFGTYTSSRHSTVLSHYTNIASHDITTYKFDCTCNESGTYAYVYPGTFGTVYLCPVFWQVSNTGTDSRAGTLIHESSHFTANGGTQDYVYGQSSAKSLASSNPDEAVFNADNHEYFAENNPALS